MGVAEATTPKAWRFGALFFGHVIAQEVSAPARSVERIRQLGGSVSRVQCVLSLKAAEGARHSSFSRRARNPMQSQAGGDGSFVGA